MCHTRLVIFIVIIDFSWWSAEITMCIVKLKYNMQYGVNTMSTLIISTHVHVFFTFSQYSEIFYTNIRIRKSAPDTESWSERSDIRTPNDIPNKYRKLKAHIICQWFSNSIYLKQEVLFINAYMFPDTVLLRLLMIINTMVAMIPIRTATINTAPPVKKIDTFMLLYIDIIF
jgi:hypothetical protein